MGYNTQLKHAAERCAVPYSHTLAWRLAVDFRRSIGGFESLMWAGPTAAHCTQAVLQLAAMVLHHSIAQGCSELPPPQLLRSWQAVDEAHGELSCGVAHLQTNTASRAAAYAHITQNVSLVQGYLAIVDAL
eukprot:5211990-Amphidinium_carterae.1